MYPAAFDYLAPTSLEEALTVLAERGDEVKILAGGQSLIPMMKLRFARPSTLMDINRLPGLKRRAAGELRGWPMPSDRPHTATDPVCGMDVEVATARWISEHEGETYYFCAPGCKTAFENAPAQYAGV